MECELKMKVLKQIQEYNTIPQLWLYKDWDTDDKDGWKRVSNGSRWGGIPQHLWYSLTVISDAYHVLGMGSLKEPQVQQVNLYRTLSDLWVLC